MKIIKLFLTMCFLAFTTSHSIAETFTAHCRDSKPDIYYENNTCTGVLPDIATEILNELGHDIKWIKAPFARTLEDAKSGRVDLILRHSMTQEREEFLNAYPYGYSKREVEFYFSPSFTADATDFSELNKLKIGALRGNFYSPQFTEINSKNLTLLTDSDQILKMLDAGRIDVAVTSKSHKIEMYKDKYRKATYIDVFLNPLHISIPKASPKAIHSQEIADRLLELRKSGKVDEYFKKYGKTPPIQSYE